MSTSERLPLLQALSANISATIADPLSAAVASSNQLTAAAPCAMGSMMKAKLLSTSTVEAALARQEAWIRIREFVRLVIMKHRLCRIASNKNDPAFTSDSTAAQQLSPPRKRRRLNVTQQRPEEKQQKQVIAAIRLEDSSGLSRTPYSTLYRYREDALFCSLRSPVTAERECALRLLRTIVSPKSVATANVEAGGTEVAEDNAIKAELWHTRVRMKQQLAVLLQQHVVVSRVVTLPPKAVSLSAKAIIESTYSSHSQSQYENWALEWTAWWKNDFASLTTKKDWTCFVEGIWLSSCFDAPYSNDFNDDNFDRSSNQQRHRFLNSPVIAVALADLCAHVLKQDTWLWNVDLKSSKYALSPLACLLASYHNACSCSLNSSTNHHNGNNNVGSNSGNVFYQCHCGNGNSAANTILKRVLSQLLCVTRTAAVSHNTKKGASTTQEQQQTQQQSDKIQEQQQQEQEQQHLRLLDEEERDIVIAAASSSDAFVAHILQSAEHDEEDEMDEDDDEDEDDDCDDDCDDEDVVVGDQADQQIGKEEHTEQPSVVSDSKHQQEQQHETGAIDKDTLELNHEEIKEVDSHHLSIQSHEDNHVDDDDEDDNDDEIESTDDDDEDEDDALEDGDHDLCESGDDDATVVRDDGILTRVTRFVEENDVDEPVEMVLDMDPIVEDSIEERFIFPTRGLLNHSYHNHQIINEVREVEIDTGLTPSFAERKSMIIQASMQILATLYPPLGHNYSTTVVSSKNLQLHGRAMLRSDTLSLSAENSLMEGINRIIKPLKKPLNTRIILRRAPTQEEFFRGNLSRNPISISMLQPTQRNKGGGNHGHSVRSNAGNAYDPTVADLRQHIANDLQMADSAELIEIMVANKILDVNLKLRVVHQVLWRSHLIESSSSNGTSCVTSSSVLNASGLPILFSSGFSERLGRNITTDTPLSALPPMIATYRLAGVDGEATEDTVAMLVDPEAPDEASSLEEHERLMEEEYGLTRLVTGVQRGINILLRSIQHSLQDVLRCIRRDDVSVEKGGFNPTREKFKGSMPCAGLTLLRFCSHLASNRKLLLKARAPTLLLTLLLDVLKALEEKNLSGNISSRSNPTAECLQELIESLSTDISTEESQQQSDEGGEYDSDCAQDGASMPLLLESIETISLSPPLRNVIAKLLPFLTYGQADLSRTLAQHFDRNIDVDSLADFEKKEEVAILMNTFVQTAISLPPYDVCNCLRSELIHCGFIGRLIRFIEKDAPSEPPPWSFALWPKGLKILSKKKGKRIINIDSCGKTKSLDEKWGDYYARGGLHTAFRILTGLCKHHAPTQSQIVSNHHRFVCLSHWLEATSDNNSARVKTKGLGLMAETLLDELMEGNKTAATAIKDIRSTTNQRKKELAVERRNKALSIFSAFGSSSLPSGIGVAVNVAPSADAAHLPSSNSVIDAGASVSAPVHESCTANITLDNADSSQQLSATSSLFEVNCAIKNKDVKAKKPAWFAEMEAMEDDVGLTCVVCHEGRSLQPAELLGLYAYVKKVSIPLEQGGARNAIDGSDLLRQMPETIPDYLVGDLLLEEYFLEGKAAADSLSSKSLDSSVLAGGKKNCVYTTTVSAGNAIHFVCHRSARNADRNHPKAPKSEWEGAILRNNRANCNVILPLVSSRSSKVPLMAVDAALTEHQAAVSNLLGGTPKSMLWTVLLDVRLLLLRIAYGEALNSDCGGGSLLSNCQLVFYQLLMADMFGKDAQVDQPKQSLHARGLSSGFLATCASITAKEDACTPKGDWTLLIRGIADAAPMAALTSILFHNSSNGNNNINTEGQKASSKCQWHSGKDHFVRGLIMCSGRRHALGLEGSGCLTTRNTTKSRTLSFADWEVLDQDESDLFANIGFGNDFTKSLAFTSASSAARNSRSSNRRRLVDKPSLDDFQNALRPMITFYAMMDSLSDLFELDMDDAQIEEKSNCFVQAIESCRRSRSIHELLNKVNVNFDESEIINLLQRGMMAA